MQPDTSATRLAPSVLREAERIEREAWADMLEGAPPRLQASLGIEVERLREAAALRCPGIDHVLVNRVLGLASLAGPQPLGRGEVEHLLSAYARLGIPRYFVHAPPGDPTLPQWLIQAGLTRFHRNWIKLVRQAGPVQTARTSLEIAQVTALHAVAFADVVGLGFGLPEPALALWASLVGRPRWHLFGAFEGRKPVAAAGMFVDAGSAYLAFGVTLPGYRERGAQSALLERRLRVAFALGASLAVSETGEAAGDDPQHSYGNLTRAGLAPAYSRENWAPPGTRW